MPYIIDEGSAIIAADCILDNRDELIVELGTDLWDRLEISKIPSGRIICLAYQRWGYDFIRHIKGIFAIAIYNTKENKVFLCTDRTSSRCLYYYKDESKCIFSTLMSPIKQMVPGIRRNEMYLKDYALIPGLIPNISSTETPWQGIFIIEAGCCVTISETYFNTYRYYEPKLKELPGDIALLKKEFLDVYGKAVECASRTSGGVGIALSGGFDSASVAALAEPILKNQNKNLISYTYVPFYNMSRFYNKRMITNETEYVKEVSKMYPGIETNFVDNDGKSFWDILRSLLM